MWFEAIERATPPQRETLDDVQAARDWLWYARSILETYTQGHILLPSWDLARRALILSRRGLGGAWLSAIPSEQIFSLRPPASKRRSAAVFAGRCR